jgi:alpha-tubulin suppressor-like RCC1 family protein
MSSPTQIGTDDNWSNASIGQVFAAAVKNNGTLWTWGNNENGQLGLGDKTNTQSPTQVGTSTNWSSVDVSLTNGATAFTAAVKTDGTLWLWGRNEYGKLGTTYGHKSSPTQVGALTTWSSVAIGRQHTAAISTNGTLWLWGRNSYGQTGFNTNSGEVASPTQLGTGTDWSKVSHSGDHALATKTNGTLWAWGQNTLGGNLGINDIIARSSPVQVGTGTNWSLISAGRIMSVATKTDGTLWTWGRNSVGQLGLNTQGTVNYKSSPTQVGALSTWKLVAMGQYQNFGFEGS